VTQGATIKELDLDGDRCRGLRERPRRDAYESSTSFTIPRDSALLVAHPGP